MKAGDAGRNSAATAKHGRRTDFLFVGAGVAPLALMLDGQTGIAILLFVPLLIAACLCGAWEQVVSTPDDAAGCANRMDRPGGEQQAASSVSLRNQLRK